MNDEIKVEKDMKPKLIGSTYFKKPSLKSKHRYSFGIYECQYCKKEFEAQVNNIKNGTKSCGCQKNLSVYTIKHGLYSNKFYKTWYNMINRCTNTKNKAYKNYGGRGIKVCEDWLDVKNFIEWAEATHIEGMTLDRIDNDKGYNPTNCNWSTRIVQNTNQRIKKNNTSGFIGVGYQRDCPKNPWKAGIIINKQNIHLGLFKTIEEAVQARDIYIIENSLPHKLSTDYKKENK